MVEGLDGSEGQQVPKQVPKIEKRPLSMSLREKLWFTAVAALISAPFTGMSLIIYADIKNPKDVQLEELGFKILVGGVTALGVALGGMHLYGHQ